MPQPEHSSVHAIIDYDDALHRTQVIERWRQVLGYQDAHNEPGLSIDMKLAVQDGLFFVAWHGSRVVGTILAGYDGHRGWLYSVAVHHSRALVQIWCGTLNGPCASADA